MNKKRKGDLKMKNLQERIKMAEVRVEESEGRRRRFMERYQSTGEKLSLELAQDEEKQISRLRVAISEAYIKLGEKK